MKTIYHVSVEVYGEQDFFFNSKGKLLTWWDRNDANYRQEYMNPLFEALGIIVEEAEYNDIRFKSIIQENLRSCGATDKELE